MTGPTPLAMWRRLMASAADEPVAMWYLGASRIESPGRAAQPVIQVEAVMVMEARTLADDACEVLWWEIGGFRDPLTGEVATRWRNPLTGAEAGTPPSFREGPGRYLVRQVEGTLVIALEQPNAEVLDVTVEFDAASSIARLTQVEVKRRSFPRPDGTLPPLSAGAASAGHTTLEVFAPRDLLGDDAPPSAPSRGAYAFSLAAPPEWMGLGDRAGTLVTSGMMAKSRLDAPPNRRAWENLRRLFPDDFDGERLRARHA